MITGGLGIVMKRMMRSIMLGTRMAKTSINSSQIYKGTSKPLKNFSRKSKKKSRMLGI